MKYIIAVILFQSFLVESFSQDTTFQDSRDGNIYDIVELGDLYWFSSNLKYKSEHSFCFENPNNTKCNENNYYYYSDLDSVCPVGWRIPIWDEWQNTVYIFADKNDIHRDSIRLDSSDLNRFSIIITGINLYEDTVGFNLKSVGWIEGNKAEKDKKLYKRQASTFWINEPETNDSTTHIHIGITKYVKHAHDHHIVDKPKLTRRFTVRCVKEKHVLTKPKMH